MQRLRGGRKREVVWLAGSQPEGGGDGAWGGRQGLVGGEKALGSGVDLSPCVEEDPGAALGFTRRETEAQLVV